MTKIIDNPYEKEGKPTFLGSYCIYMDILGFKEEYNTAIKHSEEELILNKIIKAMNNCSILLDDFKSVSKDEVIKQFKYKIFSDNIIIGYPVQFADPTDEFFLTISNVVAAIQFNLVAEGLFVRGAIDIGNLYIGDQTILGEVLLNVVSIEEEQIKNIL